VNALLTSHRLLILAVIALGAAGTYLLLPHRHGTAKPRRVHAAGAVLAGLAVALLAALWTPPGPSLAQDFYAAALSRTFFYAFGLAAVAGGILTITSVDPIHSALWFASVVLSGAGLFLLAGAQFLAAGTVIVYAGAIVVMFLFVIMLAQVGGRAPYDRSARDPARAAVTCFTLLGALLYALLTVQSPGTRRAGAAETPASLVPAPRIVSPVMPQAVRDTGRLPDPTAVAGQPPPHVAALGGTLFTDHLLSVEVAGAILFVALVGAMLIAAPRAPVRPGAARNPEGG
jgi:NADH-quinone oxidoreductase subunit J